MLVGYLLGCLVSLWRMGRGWRGSGGLWRLSPLGGCVCRSERQTAAPLSLSASQTLAPDLFVGHILISYIIIYSLYMDNLSNNILYKF